MNEDIFAAGFRLKTGGHRISREGPMACRLAGGGNRIRTAGPTCDRDAD
jgi:hypothetical protein